MKKILIPFLVFASILTGGAAYAVDAIALHNQYVEQIAAYVAQVQRSEKPKYIGYEYFGEDESGFGMPEQIYSVVYRNDKTTVVVNYYDNAFQEAGACPLFATADPRYNIKGIKVGASTKVLEKSPIFVKNGRDKYTSEYDAFPISVYHKNGKIIWIYAGFSEEPIASPALDFIKGKVPANIQ